ncbi:hypothetical protein C2S51_004061 [Perilla frutescens var. frutescens]|nr:hypothetical protein C2S51_004061 [Perilla frutescens var. frutescens]
MSEPLAKSEELNHSFLGRRRSAITTGIAAIITLACIILFKTNKQRASTEGSGRFPIEVLRCFSFAEIRSATRNFSPASFIEHRGFGVIYEGLIDDWRCKVVVKRLLFEYWDEVKALSKLRHDNLVSLIGYCNESGNMLLVYEAGMPLGTLADNLNSNTLSWEQRLRICIGVARGLDYLHTGTDHGVIHGDLKSSNILLDENYKPKISGFGLTKIDDETVLQHRQLAQKLDVCSFGIVLLELLCGGNQPELISWARSLIAIGDGHVHDQIVDPRLQGQISNICLRKFVAISEKCLHDDPKKRPTMVQLVARLELLLENHVSNATMIQGSEFVEATRGGAGPKGRETSSAHSTLLRHRNKEPMLCDVLQCKSMSKFEAATQNFSNHNILCDNGVYTIYRGAYLFNNKVSSCIIYRGMFMPDDTAKLEEISHLSHPNLASMVGYCCSDGKIVIGYENEGHGILFHQLSNSNQFWFNNSLSWVNRLDICIGAAEALRCLHMAKIIHGCISPTTILLDNNYCAKLATVSSNLGQFYTVGGVVYVPLDIAGSTKQTEKTDVYLFGLLLYIVFCGRKTDYSRGYPFLLHVKVDEAVKTRTLHHVTDMNLDDITGNCMTKFLQVAACCIRLMPGDRLSMDAVVEGLKEARALQIHR